MAENRRPQLSAREIAELERMRQMLYARGFRPPQQATAEQATLPLDRATEARRA